MSGSTAGAPSRTAAAASSRTQSKGAVFTLLGNWVRAAGQQAGREGNLPAFPFSNLQLAEEVVALVVGDDEGREVLDLDAPDRFHAELRVLQHLDLPDAVLGQDRRRAADRA